MISALAALAPLRGRLNIAHQSGAADLATVREAYAGHGFTARVEGYFEAVDREYAVTDLVLSAAGAVTCAELMCAGRAAALIALPASGHHQRHNARAMEERRAAGVLDPTSAGVGETLLGLLADADRRKAMADRAREAARPEAARTVARRLLELANGRG